MLKTTIQLEIMIEKISKGPLNFFIKASKVFLIFQIVINTQKSKVSAFNLLKLSFLSLKANSVDEYAWHFNSQITINTYQFSMHKSEAGRVGYRLLVFRKIMLSLFSFLLF